MKRSGKAYFCYPLLDGMSFLTLGARVFIFYPVSALLSIFFNILRNPQHEYAEQDVELLASATALIRSMPIHRVTAHELEYLRKMDAFIEELTRLSRAAIEKTRLENSAIGQ